MTSQDSDFISEFNKLSEEAKILLQERAQEQAEFDLARKKLESASNIFNQKRENLRNLVDAKAGIRVFM